jgi:hypothetical protein
VLARNEPLQIVSADLQYLRREWTQEIDDDSLRRSSTVLRLLLVPNELQRAWKDAGFAKEPRILTFTLTALLKLLPVKTISIATAGGPSQKGARAACFQVLTTAQREAVQGLDGTEADQDPAAGRTRAGCVYRESLPRDRRRARFRDASWLQWNLTAA